MHRRSPCGDFSVFSFNYLEKKKKIKVKLYKIKMYFHILNSFNYSKDFICLITLVSFSHFFFPNLQIYFTQKKKNIIIIKC